MDSQLELEKQLVGAWEELKSGSIRRDLQDGSYTAGGSAAAGGQKQPAGSPLNAALLLPTPTDTESSAFVGAFDRCTFCGGFEGGIILHPDTASTVEPGLLDLFSGGAEIGYDTLELDLGMQINGGGEPDLLYSTRTGGGVDYSADAQSTLDEELELYSFVDESEQSAGEVAEGDNGENNEEASDGDEWLSGGHLAAKNLPSPLQAATSGK